MLPSHPAVPDPGDVGLDLPDEAPVGSVGIGVVAPYDFALDRELWRWVPEQAALLLTRTPFSSLPVSVEQATTVGDPDTVAACTSSLIATRPEVVAYACTSGSFVGGVAGERALVASMLASGTPAAVTSSGALLMALRHLGIRRLAVATPYDQRITDRLRAFLSASGITVTASTLLQLRGLIWRVPYGTTVELVREAVARDDCEAVFISCTNLPTYDLIAPLERELGIPVLTANQVTLWAALRLAGIAAIGEQQRLLAVTHHRPAA